MERETVFSYCIEIGSREFMVSTDARNSIHFEDVQDRRSQREPSLENLDLQAFCGSQKARAQLQDERKRFTVSRPIPEALASHLEVARDMFDAGKWATEHEERLDELLNPVFWEDINPRLVSPLTAAG